MACYYYLVNIIHMEIVQVFSGMHGKGIRGINLLLPLFPPPALIRFPSWRKLSSPISLGVGLENRLSWPDFLLFYRNFFALFSIDIL
jgi:hypothetical protein